MSYLLKMLESGTQNNVHRYSGGGISQQIFSSIQFKSVHMSSVRRTKRSISTTLEAYCTHESMFFRLSGHCGVGMYLAWAWIPALAVVDSWWEQTLTQHTLPPGERTAHTAERKEAHWIWMGGCSHIWVGSAANISYAIFKEDGGEHWATCHIGLCTEHSWQTH